MSKLDQQGSVGLVIGLVVSVGLFLVTLVFAIVAFSNSQNYKNNVDQIAAKRVQIAVAQNSTQKDNEFAEQQKSPLKTFNGPSTYGSIVLQYPKTWSAYVDESGQGQAPIDGYFNPNFVPGIEANTSSYALRLQVTSDGYNDELQSLDGATQSGDVKVTPFTFDKVKGVVGVKVTGQIDQNTNGTMIIVPLRDKAIKLWTETDQFTDDFNKYVLPNFKFSP